MAAKRPTPGHSRSSPRWLSLSPRRVLTRGTRGAQAAIDNPAAKNTISVAHTGPEECGAGEREEFRISFTPSAMLDRRALPLLRYHLLRLFDAKDQAERPRDMRVEEIVHQALRNRSRIKTLPRACAGGPSKTARWTAAMRKSRPFRMANRARRLFVAPGTGGERHACRPSRNSNRDFLCEPRLQ
jgi:hypothetical protein